MPGDGVQRVNRGGSATDVESLGVFDSVCAQQFERCCVFDAFGDRQLSKALVLVALWRRDIEVPCRSSRPAERTQNSGEPNLDAGLPEFPLLVSPACSRTSAQRRRGSLRCDVERLAAVRRVAARTGQQDRRVGLAPLHTESRALDARLFELYAGGCSDSDGGFGFSVKCAAVAPWMMACALAASRSVPFS